MTLFDRRVQAAQGYLELGLPQEAHEEIESIEPRMRALTAVLALRVAIFQTLGQWKQLAAVAGELCARQPGEPQWPLSLAYATRREHSLPAALAVLTEAVGRFPGEAVIHFNLACYEAQLGRLDLARRRLAEAIRLEPACRAMAAADPDLAPLREKPS